MATGERLKALQGRLPVHSLEKTLHPGESLQAILAESLTEKVRLFFHFTYQEIVMKRLIVPPTAGGSLYRLDDNGSERCGLRYWCVPGGLRCRTSRCCRCRACPSQSLLITPTIGAFDRTF
jgi:hypothetical protein